MLTLTLRKLERDGLVIRTAYAEVPPRVEYEPSELATTLIPHAVAPAGWAIDHNPHMPSTSAVRPVSRSRTSRSATTCRCRAGSRIRAAMILGSTGWPGEPPAMGGSARSRR